MSRIIDIAKEISSGLTPLRSNLEYWQNGTIPWLKTEQIGEYRIKTTNEYVTQKALESTGLKLYPKNTISVAMYGEGKTRGNVSIIDYPMTTNQACCNIVVNEDIVEPFYLYYFLKTQYHNLRQLSSGVRKNLNSNDIKNYKINLPNKTIQKNIVNFLYSIDEKIELNNKINSKLENLAKTLYDYWFVQFDFPDENERPYKSSGGKMIYSKELKREIPVIFEQKELQDFCNIFTGKKDVKMTVENGKYPFFSCAPDPLKSNDYIFDGNAILVAGNGSYTGRVSYYKGKFDLYQRTYACTLKNTDKDLIPFLYYFMKFFFEPQYKGGTHGSAIPYIVLGDLANLGIPFNSVITNKFNNVAKPILKAYFKNSEENKRLIQIRDFLLPMLMNGQISITAE